MSARRHTIDAVREWIFMVAPVALYLLAEHLFFEGPHRSGYFGSAEWGIASAFLCMATSHVLFFDAQNIDRRNWTVNRTIVGFIAVLMTLYAIVVVMISAKILSMHGKEPPGSPDLLEKLTTLQWLLFATATGLYLWFKTLFGRCQTSSA